MCIYIYAYFCRVALASASFRDSGDVQRFRHGDKGMISRLHKHNYAFSRLSMGHLYLFQNGVAFCHEGVVLQTISVSPKSHRP